MLREALKNLGRSPSDRAARLRTLKTKAEHLMAESRQLFENVVATNHQPGISDHSLRDTSAVVLGVQVREGPNTQDRDQHLIVLYCHLFADTMATNDPPVLRGRLPLKISAVLIRWRNTCSLCWTWRPSRA